MTELNVILFLVNFLRTLFFILIIYYVIRFINRYLLPFFGSSSNPASRHRPEQNRRPEGDVRLEKNQSYGSRIPRDEGEYVDFEEID
ncbi:hypothetical protein [Gaoshiqia sp. Z1-71]|uniref:hypothetical protein n=1 Tax=Gaoshiqia hydrogeniformans TaxID=3290090 RepID=UPI003BF8EAB9